MTTFPAHPGTYDIRIRGHLDRHWAIQLGVPELAHDADGTTVLRGVAADQAALHGLLQRIRDLGITLIAVTLVPHQNHRLIPSSIKETNMTTTTQRITSDTLIRATGPFAIAAGLIFAGIQPIHPPDFVASVTTTPWTVIITLKLLMCLFFLVGIAGLYLRQAGTAGWLGLAAFVTFSLSWWLQTGFVFTELFVLPPLASVSPAFVDSVLGIVNQHPGPLDIGALGTVYGALGLLYLVGGILLGAATLRAGVLPRIPSILLAAAALATPAAALLPHELQRYAAVPMGIAFIWLGFALWFPAAKRTSSTAGATLRPATAD